MRVISVIEEQAVIEKILKTPWVVAHQFPGITSKAGLKGPRRSRRAPLYPSPVSVLGPYMLQ